MIAIDTYWRFNSLHIITSLPSTELHTGERLRLEVKNTLEKQGHRVAIHDVAKKVEFAAAMEVVRCAASASSGREYPALHIDTHGTTDESGIALTSGDRVRWDEFGDACRAINDATDNNMLLTMGLCSGYQAMVAMDVACVAPFFAIVGAAVEVSAGEVDAFSSFYEELFRTEDLKAATRKLSDNFGTSNAEELFLHAFAGYIRNECMGRDGEARRERLLTSFLEGRDWSPRTLKWARRRVKEALKPTDPQFRTWKGRFLLSDRPANEGRFMSTLALAKRAAPGQPRRPARPLPGK